MKRRVEGREPRRGGREEGRAGRRWRRRGRTHRKPEVAETGQRPALEALLPVALVSLLCGSSFVSNLKGSQDHLLSLH